jgi:hypothetical protein
MLSKVAHFIWKYQIVNSMALIAFGVGSLIFWIIPANPIVALFSAGLGTLVGLMDDIFEFFGGKSDDVR